MGQRDGPDRGDGLGSAIPRVFVLVDGRWERGDVELVRGLAPERPGRAFGAVGVDEEVELAVGGVVGGDVE